LKVSLKQKVQLKTY